MSQPSVLSTMSELGAHDGEQVVIEGVYTKRMSQRKMNDPKLYFFGFIDLEVDGGRIQLSSFRRHDGEVAAFEGKKVRVAGKLVMDRGAGAEYARPDPTPTLLDPGDITAVE